jgi:RNA polymerase sigma factor (sigma-70 family)
LRDQRGPDVTHRRVDVEARDDRADETVAEAQAEGAAVRAAVARLPRRQRDALFLRFYLDFDYAAIAGTLGVEVGTVSALLHAARQGLARNLQEVA